MTDSKVAEMIDDCEDELNGDLEENLNDINDCHGKVNGKASVGRQAFEVGPRTSPDGFHWCHRCRDHKPVEEFPYENRAAGKLAGYCKTCLKAYKGKRQALDKAKATLPQVVDPKGVRPRPPSATNEMVLANHTTVEAVTFIRDQALAIAKSFSGRRVSTDLKEVLAQITILKDCNKIIITNSLFLAENVDLATITDEQLIELAMRAKEEKDNAGH